MPLVLRCADAVLREASAADDDLLVSLIPDDFEHDPTFPRLPGSSLTEHRGRWMRHWLTEFRQPAAPGDRHLVFLVELGGRPVGLQTLEGPNLAERREVESTSFVVPAARGRRLGVAMRTAVLALAFERLDAVRAVSAANPANIASRLVSERVGYRPVTSSEPGLDQFEMTREMWFAEPRPAVTFTGEVPWQQG